MGDQVSLSSFQKDLGIPINFQEESGLVTSQNIELNKPLKVSRDVRPLSRRGGELGFSLGSLQRIQTSLHLER